jgi:putative endonuclease
MTYVVYMLASGRHGTLYVGVRNDLPRRIFEHKERLTKGFASKYGVTRFVW